MAGAAASHSIWLVPDRAGPTFERLKQLIVTLAAKSGGDVFDPHVTLVGSLGGEPSDLARDTRRLAAGLAPFEMTLGLVVARPADPSRYRRLFLAIDRAPRLIAANAQARRRSSVRGATYEPHLSLAYADVAAAAFGELRAAADGAGFFGASFTAPGLELWRTEGPVEGWRLEAAFPLQRVARAR